VRAFVASQFETAAFYSSTTAPGAHLTPFEAFEVLGRPFCIAAALSVSLLPFVRDARARLLGLFPLVYVTAFWGRPVRAYYMAAPAAGWCVLIGACLGIVLCGLGWDAPTAEPTASAAAASPSLRAQILSGTIGLGALLLVAWAPSSTLDEDRRFVSNATRARNWLYEHVPSGTRLFHYGDFIHGPRLVTSSWKAESQCADFFDYGRRSYHFYRSAAKEAYADYRSQGRPWYTIDSFGRFPEPARKVSKHWLTRSLAARARRYGQEYIILAGFGMGGDYRRLGYSWFDQVELAQQFDNIAIFRVPSVAPRSDGDEAGSEGSEGEPDAALAGTHDAGG
jgi:hypothetical protein